MGMKLMKNEGLQTPSWRVSTAAGEQVSHVPALFAKRAKRAGQRPLVWMGRLLLALWLAAMAWPQGVSTTTVQGTEYLANGQPGAGTLVISWPGFTTAAGQAVAADSMTVTIAPDGFVSVNLAPNQGATPAGEYYTAVYYMSDGTVNTQYWVIPAAAQATLAQVQVQIMPATEAVQAVSKAYVDEAITELSESLLTASGGTLSGPLYLNGDPTQPMQAATKHYVDTQVATAVPLAGGNMTGALTTPAVNGVETPTAASGQSTLQAAMNAAGTNGAMEIPPNYAGTDRFTSANGVKVVDWRTSGSQQTERSVKEFGAVCDGVTDDTSALQSALDYANAHGVALVLPEGICKTRTLSWRGESIGGLGKQVSALMGFPGEDVLVSGPDALNILSSTRLHDLTIYVDQSVDASCSPAEGRAAAGACQLSRAIEANSIFSPRGNGLTGTAGTGAAWWVGNCAIAMQATTGAGGNGLRVAEMENVEIATTGVDPMAAQYPGAHSTHTCGLYLAQWPQWSDFRNVDIRGVNTGVVIPALPATAPAELNADSNRWQNVTIQATHAFTAAAGSNNVLDNVVAIAGNSAATGEP
ncbi:MAG: glycosyl hydrolase family 28-related protein, partial [Terracidiphilus sp.]